MLMIALTGIDRAAQAAVTEQILSETNNTGHAISVVMGLETRDEINALRARPGDKVALWRIGQDPARHELDGLLNDWLPADDINRPNAVARALMGFWQLHVTAPTPNPLAHRHNIPEAP